MNYLSDKEEIMLELAQMQGEIFEESITLKIPSFSFIQSYMNSDYAKTIDKFLIDDQSLEKKRILLELKNHIKRKNGTLYSSEEMHWIGYIYRIMAIKLDMNSAKLFKIVKPAYLRKVFINYHTISIEKAIELIKHDLNINPISKEERIKLILKMQ